MDIGQAAFQAIMIVAEAFVIQAEQVQNRGMKVVDGSHVLDSFVAELVGRPVSERSLDARSR